MKRKIAMLLCLVMVMAAALCGCSGPDPLVGTWNGVIDLADALNSELAADAEMGEYMQVSSFAMNCTLTFTEEGTYSMVVDEAALSTEFENMKTELVDGMYLYLDALIADEGLDMTADELLESAGVTMEEMLDAAISEDIVSELASSLTMEGNYKTDDDKLFLSDGLDYGVDETMYELFTLEGDTLTLNAGTAAGDDPMTEFIYPMVFNKAA